MNKVELVSSVPAPASRGFRDVSKSFMSARTARRLHDVTLSSEEVYLSGRYERVYDRLMCQLADIESLMARYETMAPEDQAVRSPLYDNLFDERVATLRHIDQAIHLVSRVYTHLNGFFDSEFSDDDSEVGEPISVAAIVTFQEEPAFALSCAMERHKERRIVFIDRDEENWAILPDSVTDYTDEDYERLAAEDALYEEEEEATVGW